MDDNWPEVIDDPRVEAVVVTTPNRYHLEIVGAAAAAGKHVLCEKPMGASPSQTADIARLNRAAGVACLVGYNFRNVPVVQHARA